MENQVKLSGSFIEPQKIKNKTWQSVFKKAEDSLVVGVPNRKVEDWRYTPVKELMNVAWKGPIKVDDDCVLDEWKSRVKPFNTSADIYFINGEPCHSLFHQMENTGVEIYQIKDLLQENSSVSLFAEKAFEELISGLSFKNDKGDYFYNLTWKNLSGGVFIYIPPNTKVKDPIQIFHQVWSGKNQQLYSSVKNIIYLGEGSSIEVFEEFKGLESGETFNNPSLEVYQKPRSHFIYFKSQAENDKTSHIHNVHVHMEDQSRSEIFSLSTGAKWNKNQIQVHQRGNDCEAEVGGFYYTHKSQHQDHQILVNHQKPRGLSHQIYKGVLDDQSRVVFNGKIYIEQDAQKVNSKQLNQSITLSSQAEVDTKPELEILADDVSAQHGATVGELDLSQIFYLQSRGISKKMALSLLVQGFALETLEGFTNSTLKNYFEKTELVKLMKSIEKNWIS